MLCELCASVRRARNDIKPTAVEPRARNSVPVCDCCGRQLTGGTAARFVQVVTRLARFGLTGEPILARTAEGRR